MIYIYFIILIIIVFFYLINYFLHPIEHMSMRDSRLNKILNENGYEIDINEFIISKKNCQDNDVNNCKIKYFSRNFNNIESHKLSKNKPKSNMIFANNNIPVPRHIIINNKNKDKYIDRNDLSYPVVLKPVDGMQGKDVYTFIKTKEQFKSILEVLLSQYKEVMLENQVYGNNYRIFIFNNKVMDIIERQQPYIIGNGKETVNVLINKKNAIQKEKGLYATKNIDWNYIEEQGFKPENVVPENVKIFITNTINFHNGANPVRIDLEKVPKKNLDMFVKAHKLINLECSGLDYMSENIEKEYDKNNGHIIEINDMVDTQIHVDADNKTKPNFLFENILKSMNF